MEHLSGRDTCDINAYPSYFMACAWLQAHLVYFLTCPAKCNLRCTPGSSANRPLKMHGLNYICRISSHVWATARIANSALAEAWFQAHFVFLACALFLVHLLYFLTCPCMCGLTHTTDRFAKSVLAEAGFKCICCFSSQVLSNMRDGKISKFCP